MNNLKERLADMSALSQSRTPADALKYIEELEAKLAKEIKISNQRGNHIDFVLLPQMSDLHFELKDVKAKLVEYKMVAGAIDKRWAESEDEVAELQTKLAKAVDAIDGLLAVLPDDEGPEIDYARTTIAELKGESDE